MAGWRFPESYTTVEQEMAAARTACAVGDVTPHGKLLIEGAEAHGALVAAYTTAPDSIGGHLAVADGGLYRLRADLFYLSTRPGGEAAALERIERLPGERFVTVTDVTHGLADIRIIGPASRAVLSKICALDFDSDAFPNLTVKQTSLAKTKQMLIRRDFGELPAYTILGAQSLAVYVWGVILESGQEFDIAPIGVGAMALLEKDGDRAQE